VAAGHGLAFGSTPIPRMVGASASIITLPSEGQAIRNGGRCGTCLRVCADQASFDCAVCGKRSGNRLTGEGSYSLLDPSFGVGLSTPVRLGVCQRRILCEGDKPENQRGTQWHGHPEADGLGVKERVAPFDC